MMESVIDKL